jgi:hypothetical protein
MRTNTMEHSPPSISTLAIRSSVYAVLALMIGLIPSVCIKLTGRGFASDFISLLPFIADLAMAALVALIFFAELLLRPRGERLTRALFRAFFCSLVALLVGVLAWVWLAPEVPDPARIYLWLWRPYLESHWRVDPVTHLTYFPLDYTGVGKDNKEVVPHNFFVLDDRGTLVLDENPHHGISRLISPSCPGAKYYASRLDEKIYIVNNYIDDPDEPSEPCLITPMR